jgi:hypothetical protein
LIVVAMQTGCREQGGTAAARVNRGTRREVALGCAAAAMKKERSRSGDGRGGAAG